MEKQVAWNPDCGIGEEAMGMEGVGVATHLSPRWGLGMCGFGFLYTCRPAGAL